MGVRASNVYLSPILPDSFSLTGLTNFIKIMGERNPMVNYGGAIISRYNLTRNTDKDVQSLLSNTNELSSVMKFTGVIIRESADIISSSMRKQSIVNFAKTKTKSVKDIQYLFNHIKMNEVFYGNAI